MEEQLKFAPESRAESGARICAAEVSDWKVAAGGLRCVVLVGSDGRFRRYHGREYRIPASRRSRTLPRGLCTLRRSTGVVTRKVMPFVLGTRGFFVESGMCLGIAGKRDPKGAGSAVKVIMTPGCPDDSIAAVVEATRQLGFNAHVIGGNGHAYVVAIGKGKTEDLHGLEFYPHVEKVVPILQPFKLCGREVRPEDARVEVDSTVIGGDELTLTAGPCAVESRDQLLEAAYRVKEAGATILRGGAFKPRTSPYSFQGLQEEGLKLLAEAREATGLPVITEVMGTEDVELVASYCDMLQIGARNMQNFSLLRAVGRTSRPVLLKRGLSATIEEWLLAAEYIMAEGNQNVVLCERGIRTHETYTRNTLDLAAVVLAKELSYLPVIVDPSHATGRWRMVLPLSRAALAAGADGVMVEVHPRPADALSDGPQSLTPDEFETLARILKREHRALRRLDAAADVEPVAPLRGDH